MLGLAEDKHSPKFKNERLLKKNPPKKRHHSANASLLASSSSFFLLFSTTSKIALFLHEAMKNGETIVVFLSLFSCKINVCLLL